LALTSPTSGGRSVGVVRSRTQTTEFVLFVESWLWGHPASYPMGAFSPGDRQPRSKMATHLCLMPRSSGVIPAYPNTF
jgi:hypothetical protein